MSPRFTDGNTEDWRGAVLCLKMDFGGTLELKLVVSFSLPNSSYTWKVSFTPIQPKVDLQLLSYSSGPLRYCQPTLSASHPSPFSPACSLPPFMY